MAYLIIANDENVNKIALNDTEKNNLNVCFPPYSTVDISDDDFLKIKKNIATVTVSNNLAIITDIDVSNYSLTETELVYIHGGIKIQLKNFLDQNDSSNSFYTTSQNYYNYLNSFNYSNISFPLNKTWEQYCEDNLITYIHILQIP